MVPCLLMDSAEAPLSLPSPTPVVLCSPREALGAATPLRYRTESTMKHYRAPKVTNILRNQGN
jgi:hypothetical protein